MFDNRLLIANSAIYSIVNGLTDLVLVNPAQPQFGFVGQHFKPFYENQDELFSAIIHREKMQFVGERVSFGNALYSKPAHMDGADAHNHWLLTVSIQDLITNMIGKEQYHALKIHIYRMWFNSHDRIIQNDVRIRPEQIDYDTDLGVVTWKLGDLQCRLMLGEILPEKQGRDVYFTEQYQLVIDDELGKVEWVFDLALRSIGWEQLLKNVQDNRLLITLNILKENLSKNPYFGVTLDLPGV